jgi:thioredoxin-related protein
MNSLFLLALLLAGQYQPVKKYDPRRDAAKDIDTAIVEAQRTGKHILLVVGGEWCSWCHTLDNYFESHPQLLELRDRNYITVKVNWSPENMNEKALSRYPAINTYPYFFVLDKDGKLLQAQRTGLIEEGSSYNMQKMTSFLTKWGAGAASK